MSEISFGDEDRLANCPAAFLSVFAEPAVVTKGS